MNQNIITQTGNQGRHAGEHPCPSEKQNRGDTGSASSSLVPLPATSTTAPDFPLER